MQSSRTLHSILGCWFPEIQDTELPFAICANLDTEKATDSPFSLARLAIKQLIKRPFGNEDEIRQIKEIILSDPLPLCSLHLFEKNTELLKAAFEASPSETFGFLGIDVRNSTCLLTANRRHVAEFAISRGLEEVKSCVRSIVEKRLYCFRISVTDQPITNETRCEKLKRITKELEEDCNDDGDCTIGCYIHREFHFKDSKGSYIYYKKYAGLDGVCRHVTNKTLSSKNSL